MEKENIKPQLFILVNNHFDPTWRRCWKRPLEFKGKTFISYNDIETYYLLDNIELAQENPEYKFEIECALILRTILQDHPEALPVLQQLAKEGRFAVSGAGETIVDANMIHGESLVRNLVDGILWVEDTLGQKTHMLLRNDAFGNSAQLPQIAHGLGIECIFGLHYSSPQNTYWRGLDGSTVLHRPIPVAAAGGDIIKYPPCDTCNGTGKVAGTSCPACKGRGIPSGLYSKLPDEINQEALKEVNAAIVMMGPEELLPNPALIDWAKEKSADYDVHFAIAKDLLPFTEPFRANLDQVAEADLHPSVELNPNNSGVWVTRIKTKQVVRRQEQAMMGLESLLVMGALKGETYPKDALKAIRQNMYFTMFHDSITATHVDASYDELLDIMGIIDDGITGLQKKALADLSTGKSGYSVINPSGNPFTGTAKVQVPWRGGAAIKDESGQVVPVISLEAVGDEFTNVEFFVEDLPAFTAKLITIEPAVKTVASEEPLSEVSIENDRFKVDADEHGLVRVFDKVLGKDILITDEYRPAEFILEHDEGSPWATLSPDFTRTPLAQYTQLLKVEKREGVQQLVYLVKPEFRLGYSSFPMQGEFTVRLIDGLDKIEFNLKTFWSAFNHRLRVAMPVPKTGDENPHYLYEIPYGVLERQPYEPFFHWAGANGDWPAMHWAGIEQPGMSVALFNRGTPSYLMEAGKGNSEVMFLSLLRSPTIPTYLHEPYFYTMTDYEGMRDEGDHEFSFAVGAYGEDFASSSVVLDGETYQQQLPVAVGDVSLPQMPKVSSENVRLTAVKWAEEGEGVVLRLVEYRGKGGKVEIRLPEDFNSAEQVNLLERTQGSLSVKNGTVTLDLRPWEITTVKLSM